MSMWLGGTFLWFSGNVKLRLLKSKVITRQCVFCCFIPPQGVQSPQHPPKKPKEQTVGHSSTGVKQFEWCKCWRHSRLVTESQDHWVQRDVCCLVRSVGDARHKHTEKLKQVNWIPTLFLKGLKSLLQKQTLLWPWLHGLTPRRQVQSRRGGVCWLWQLNLRLWHHSWPQPDDLFSHHSCSTQLPAWRQTVGQTCHVEELSETLLYWHTTNHCWVMTDEATRTIYCFGWVFHSTR